MRPQLATTSQNDKLKVFKSESLNLSFSFIILALSLSTLSEYLSMNINTIAPIVDKAQIKNPTRKAVPNPCNLKMCGIRIPDTTIAVQEKVRLIPRAKANSFY